MRSSEKIDVIGREVFAAVELDALAKMKTPLQGIDDLPALGQAGDDLQVLVPLGQPLHDIAEGAQREALVEGIGVEGVEVALEGIAEGFRGRRRGRERKHERAHDGKGSKRHVGLS